MSTAEKDRAPFSSLFSVGRREKLMKYYLAIDIGASSGRHIIGYADECGKLQTEEMFRFPNGMQKQDGHLVWDTEALFASVLEGIKVCFEKYPKIESLSIDTWGVDYVLMKGDEAVLPAYAYRDDRTAPAIEAVHKILSFDKLFDKTGIQFQPFNTVYQLYDDLCRGRLEGVTDFLMIPEYLMYRLTGVKKKEYTLATTMGMVNASARAFDMDIVRTLGLPEHLFGELSAPGTLLGELNAECAAAVGGNTKVRLCALHDTASAVEGIPMEGNAPYVSSGTWSILGIKSAVPHTDAVSRERSYSNEGGVGYIRYQTNIMGLWIVQSLQKELCPSVSFGEIAESARASSFEGVFDVNDARFMAPASMKEAIDSAFAKGKGPKETADYFASAYRSLAEGYRVAIENLEACAGERYDSLYIVGGGAKNTYLNELTEKAIGRKVLAFPIEATAIGNLKVQMHEDGISFSL